MRGWRTCLKPQPLAAKQSPVAEEARVDSSNCVDRARGTSLVIEATGEVADSPLGMPEEPSATELLPKGGVETTSLPTLNDVVLESPHGLERVGTVNILGLRTMGGPPVVSIPQRLLLSPRCSLQRGPLQVLSSNYFSGGEMLRWLSGMVTSLEGLRTLRPYLRRNGGGV